jgi:hypothetical protein
MPIGICPLTYMARGPFPVIRTLADVRVPAVLADTPVAASAAVAVAVLQAACLALPPVAARASKVGDAVRAAAVVAARVWRALVFVCAKTARS